MTSAMPTNNCTKAWIICAENMARIPSAPLPRATALVDFHFKAPYCSDNQSSMAITSSHPFPAACRSEQSPYTPVWLMRQAGRYMEEYRKLRAEHEFLDLCKSSDLAAEITVTPVERLRVDAA